MAEYIGTFKGTVGDFIRWQMEYLKAQAKYRETGDKSMSPWFNPHRECSFGNDTLPMDYYRKTMDGSGIYEFVLISHWFNGFGEKAHNQSYYDDSIKDGEKDPFELEVAKQMDAKNPFCKKGYFVQLFTVTPEMIQKYVPSQSKLLDRDEYSPGTQADENPITGKHSSEQQPDKVIALAKELGYEHAIGFMCRMYDHDSCEQFVDDLLCHGGKGKDACDYFTCYNLRGEVGKTAADFFVSGEELRAWAKSVGLDLDYAQTERDSRDYGEFQKDVDEWREDYDKDF